MHCQLTWTPSAAASCFHTLHAALLYQPIQDRPLAMMFARPVEQCRRLGLPVELWRSLIPWAAANADPRKLAARAVATLDLDAAAESLRDRLNHAIDEALTTLQDLHPNLDEELRVRKGPIRQQWEARGPGLLAAMRRCTGAEMALPQATVILVHPATGGSGAAHPPCQAVHLEALLANPFAELPEVVRLGWLLAQLVPLPAELALEDSSVPNLLHALALLPVCLAAAEEVELARCNLPTLELALHQWHVPLPDQLDAADVLLQWWHAYRAHPQPWPTALHNLASRL